MKNQASIDSRKLILLAALLSSVGVSLAQTPPPADPTRDVLLYLEALKPTAPLAFPATPYDEKELELELKLKELQNRHGASHQMALEAKKQLELVTAALQQRRECLLWAQEDLKVQEFKWGGTRVESPRAKEDPGGQGLDWGTRIVNPENGQSYIYQIIPPPDQDPQWRIGLIFEPAQEAASDKVDTPGIVVREVLKDMPAVNGGVKPGDTFLSVNDIPLRNVQLLQSIIAAAQTEELTYKIVPAADNKEGQAEKTTRIAAIDYWKRAEEEANKATAKPINLDDAVYWTELVGREKPVDKEIASLREEIAELKDLVEKVLEAKKE